MKRRLPWHGEGELICSGLSDTKPDGVIYITNLVVGLAWPNCPVLHGDKTCRLHRRIRSGIIVDVVGSDGRICHGRLRVDEVIGLNFRKR